MFTSRAEYRLMLREDNADLRLSEIGHDLGLVAADTVKDVRSRRRLIQSEIQRIHATVVKPTPAVNAYLTDRNSPTIDNGILLDQLLKRTELDYGLVGMVAPPDPPLDSRVARQVEIEIKYDGYIQKQLKEIEKFADMETKKIPENFDYKSLHGLSTELKEKLTEIRPESLGQASRMEGITPVALSILMIALKARSRPDEKI